MTFYRRNLPHLQRDDKPHFITFVTKNHWVLPDDARDIVLRCCRHDDQAKLDLHAIVVMPDHVHMILTPLTMGGSVVSLVEILRGIKGASARFINQKLGHEGSVWQEESFDHVLRASEALDQKTLYILENPVRQGLIDDWHNYRWIWHKRFANPYALPRST
jgi:REP element-mobilizing transposase RayT